MPKAHVIAQTNLPINPVIEESWSPSEAEIFAGYTYGRVPEDKELDVLGNFDVDRWVEREGHFPPKNKR